MSLRHKWGIKDFINDVTKLLTSHNSVIKDRGIRVEDSPTIKAGYNWANHSRCSKHCAISSGRPFWPRQWGSIPDLLRLKNYRRDLHKIIWSEKGSYLRLKLICLRIKLRAHTLVLQIVHWKESLDLFCDVCLLREPKYFYHQRHKCHSWNTTEIVIS